MQAYCEIKYIYLIILILIFGNCSPKNFSSSEVNFISGNHTVLSLRAKGKGINVQEARENAEKNAVSTLLFRGIPDSEIRQAMIGTNESEIMVKYMDYFKKFFDEKRYKTFIMSSESVADLGRVEKGMRGQVIDVKINLQALKDDLELNRVIRKFGY